MLRDRQGRLRTVWRILLFVFLFGALAVVAGMLTPSGLLWSAGAQLFGAVASGWIVLSGDGKAPAALGFGLERTAPGGLSRGMALGVGAGGATLLLLALAGGLWWSGEQGSLLGLGATAVGAVWAFAIPAAAEEALLRGYPLQALAEAWGPTAALWATSLAFGALHLGNPEVSALALANLVLAGLLLGAVYLRTGSLWWATGVHLGWNWVLGFGADVRVSGLDLVDTPYVESFVSGPEWLSGGAFGPEGSVLAGAVLAAATVWVWKWKAPALAAGVDATRLPLWVPATGEPDNMRVEP